ncbi:fused MFS/spermidine synthase [Candidatus Saccharibacteria bacterium]|nr:fused MFS/spermidine synthase [Candidatus Saccharibacteria bacterium]
MKRSIARIREHFRNKIDYIILFVLNSAEMILELVAARLLSPYFGNSNFVWTAIIGIILLATSLGNVVGGKIASWKNPKFWVGSILLLASIYISFTPIIDAPILQSIKDVEMGVQISSIVGSIIFFLIPSIILGTITPVIMKERIGNSKDKGKESGRITATIAIGSLAGTFLGGFLLIPALGTKLIFSLLGAIIIPAVILLRPLRGVKIKKYKISFTTILFIAIMTSVISVVVANFGTKYDAISIDTEYGRIIIEDGQSDGEDIRYYRQSGAYSSATYLDEERKFELVFDYLKKYDMMFDYLDVKQVAMIGGAAYQYPKYFISHYLDKKMDVIEIDPVSTEIAKKYFYLDDLISTYGEERLGLYNDDGRVFLSNINKKYDAILNDAFSGEVPVGILATLEAAETIKQQLNPDGVYMSNILSAIEGDGGRFLRAEIKTLKKVFKHVYVVQVNEGTTRKDFTNWMVIATDNDKHQPETIIEVDLSDDDIVLTDDYNPIDSLISTRYHDN